VGDRLVTETRLPPPGWYLDASPGLLRWFDGTTWTDRTAPAPRAPQAPAPSPAPDSRFGTAAESRSVTAAYSRSVTAAYSRFGAAAYSRFGAVEPAGQGAASVSRFGAPTGYAPSAAPTFTPAVGSAPPKQDIEISVISLVAVAVAGLTVFFWGLFFPCGILGMVAVGWERHTGNNRVVFGGIAIAVAALARIAIRVFDSWGPFF
jgi:hypothetical protein